MPVSLMLAALMVAVLAAAPARAQVQVDYNGSELVVSNAGFADQRAVRTSGKTGGGWMIEDETGNAYQATCESTCSQDSDGSWTCSGFESSDGVDQDIVTGYDKALQLLVDKYGAVVEHDPVAGIDVVSFPDAEDPYDLLATALLEEYLDGRQLVEYFKSLELNSVGVTGGTYEAAKPRGRQLRFPDDPYFTSQWNLQATNLLKAQLLPEGVGLKDGVRVAILDSGINESDARHDGLDGVRSIEHIWTAPATGFSDNHGLAVTSLLADQGNDGDGPVGLMGSIDASCGDYQTAFTQRPADVLSYSVGAWGPMSNFVISALHQAIKEDGADIVLMNFRMAYSPQVQMAIEEAIERGVIVVAAAGNYHPAHRTKPVGFPASVEGVISVGSANRGKKASRFSAVGAVILAPGEDIVVGLPDGVWAYGSGTSFAAPHVAATAALIKLIDPEITSPEIGALLQETASGSSRPSWRPRRGGSSGGEGFLDAEGAVEAVLKGSGDDGDGHHIGPRNVWGHLGECDLGKTGETFAASEVPIEAALKGNYPNPFNPTTRIAFTAPAEGTATFTVYDILGRIVHRADVDVTTGDNSITFSGSDLTSGTYFYDLAGEEWELGGRMMLVK